MARFRKVWHPAAAQELISIARSNPPSSGRLAGEIYEVADRLSPAKVKRLPQLRNSQADVRWWDIGNYAAYFRIDGRTIEVLHIGKSTTDYQRRKSDAAARLRA